MTASSAADIPLTRSAAAPPHPLSYGQQRLWFLHELHGASLEYHVPEAYRLLGALDRSALRQALERLAARHEVLRTAIHTVGGRPMQTPEPPPSIELPVDDLQGLPPAASDRRIAEALSQEWERPFDLASGRLLRARLLRLADECHILLLTTHHIASDGWSQGVLRHELGVLYRAYTEGLADPLPAPSIEYADFAAWQRARVEAGVFDADVAYWKQRLAGLPPMQDLPADRPRGGTAAEPAPMHAVPVPRDLAAALFQVGRDRGATPYMTLLAAFAVLLSRHSGRDDIAVGSPIAGRTHAALERMVGFFVNTVVLRTRVRPDQPFSELLEEVRQDALDAYQHQDAPFERVVEELSPQRRLDRTPLFQVLLAMAPAPPVLQLPGLVCEEVEPAGVRSRFDLELHAVQAAGDLTLQWVYDRNLFDHWRIEQLARTYLSILEQAVADPDRPVGALEVLDAEDRHWLTSRRGPDLPEAGTGGAYARFAQRLAQDPDAPAVRHGEEVVSYRELDRLAARIAHGLADAGVVPGERIGIDLPLGVEYVAAVLGALRYGVVFVPVSADEPPNRRTLILRDAEAEFVLTPEEIEASADIQDPDSSFGTPDPTSEAYLDYVPSAVDSVAGVRVSHEALAVRVAMIAERFDMRPSDRVLVGAASVAQLLAPLTAGATLVLASDSADPDSVLDAIQRGEVTLLDTTPTVLRSLVDRPAFAGCRSLRGVVCGGEPLPPGLHRDLRKVLTVRLWQVYGAAETSGPCLVQDVTDDAGAAGRYGVPIGSPGAGVVALVLDSRGGLVPCGVVGELCIGGAGIADGYLGQSRATDERFGPNPFAARERLWRSGDLARWRPDGALEFVGRKDTQLKVAGRRVEPDEAAAALLRHPGVREAVVAVAVADDAEDGSPAAADKPVAYAVLTEPGAAAPDQLDAHLARWLAPAARPATVVLVDALPRTPAGDVDMAQLRALRQDAAAGPVPGDAVTAALCEIFAEVLGLPGIAPDDSFFVLGGHSLMAMTVIAKILEGFGVELAIRDVFEAPTPAELAVLIGTRTGSGAAPA